MSENGSPRLNEGEQLETFGQGFRRGRETRAERKWETRAEREWETRAERKRETRAERKWETRGEQEVKALGGGMGQRKNHLVNR